MFRPSQPAVVTVGALVATLLAGPGVARAADPVTPLTATAMAAELRTAATTSTAAAAAGWRAALTLSGGGLTASGSYVADPASAILEARIHVLGLSLTEIAVGGRGTYDGISDAESRRALRMIGHPSAHYAFTPSKLSFSAYVKQSTVSPAFVLTDDTKHAGTRTTRDDGSTDYAYTAADHTAVRLHLDPSGVLTAARGTESGLDARFTYTYDPQHLTAPAAADTVSAATLERAVDYLHMTSFVHDAAHEAAADAKSASHGGTVTTATVRKYARRDASSINSAIRQSMVKVHSTTGGARLSATNPWTHETISYTLKASGRKVTITKGR